MQRMMSFWLGALVAALLLLAMAPGTLSWDPDALVDEHPDEEPEEGEQDEGSSDGQSGSRGLEEQGPKRPEPPGGDGSSSGSTGRGLFDDNGDDDDGEEKDGGAQEEGSGGANEQRVPGPGDGSGEDAEEEGDKDDGQEDGSSGPEGDDQEAHDNENEQDPEPGSDAAGLVRGRSVPCVEVGSWPEGRCNEGLDVAGLLDLLIPGVDEGPQDPDAQEEDEGGSDVKPFTRSQVVVPEKGPDLLAWGAGVGLFAVVLGVLVRLFTVYHLGRGLLPAGWRLDRDRVVNHPVRREILDHLKKHPGATIQELADGSGVANSRAAYHLSVLKREECVSEREVEGRRHFFLHAAPVVDPERLRKRAIGRSDRSPGRVLMFIRQSPGATVSHVARALGFSPGHAHYHLTRLAKEGLLDRVRRGRRVRHYLTDEGHELVVPQEEARAPPASLGSTSTNELAA